MPSLVHPGLITGLGGSSIVRGSYTANPVNFDGASDYLTRGAELTGASDSKLYSGSFWVRRTGGLFSKQLMDTTSDKYNINGNISNEIDVGARNAAGTQILVAITGASLTVNEWSHIMFSVDMSDTGKRHFYLDGVSSVTWFTYTDDTIDFTVAETSIGGNITGGNLFPGDVSDLWIAPGQYIDLSVEANREKFVKDGKPVDLGDDGSVPTGTAPLMFFSGDTASWHTNKGTGGGFTENGALTDGTGPVEF